MPPSISSYTCPECGKSYRAKETLTRHRKNHESFSPYYCHLCSNSFKRKDLLTRHIATHESKDDGQLRARRANNSACQRCSLRKLRCDGLNPCSKCSGALEPCRYLAFHFSRDQPEHAQEIEAGVVNFASVDDGPSQTQPLFTASTHSQQLQSVDNPWNSSEYADQYYDPTALDSSGWPWLHEAMYMQNESMWPGSSSTDRSTYANVSLAPIDVGATSVANSLANISVVPNTVVDSASGVENFTGLPEQASTARIDPSSYPVNQSSSYTSSQPEQQNDQAPQPGLRDFSKPPTPRIKTGRETVLDEIVTSSLQYAENPSFGIWNRQETCAKIFKVFDLSGVGVSADSILDYFVGLYFMHFHLLWPLFHQKTLQAVHRDAPYLYLTLSAVGSAFAGDAAWQYHALLLNALRRRLTLACFSDTMPDHQLECLCGALELIRISYMYFGHARALTAVQMVGGALIYLARKLDLFGGVVLSNQLPLETSRRFASPQWIRSETRKHLAAGLLMLENDVSLLFGTRPLVSAEEFGISLPCSHGVWTSESVTPPDLSQVQVQQPLFSQLVHIALDLNEPYPNLDPFAMKMIMHGIQDHVWRYSYEHGFMYQFGQAGRGIAPVRPCSSGISSDPDLLDHSRRPMKDYWRGRQRLVQVLDRWKQTLETNALPQHAESQRSSLLAGHLLFHLSFMKIWAPLSSIHQLFLDTGQGNTNNAAAHVVRAWAHTEDASKAAHHALTVRAVLKKELDRAKEARAKFMVLSQLGMFHGAAILWAITGTRPESELRIFDPLVGEDIGLSKASSPALMLNYAEILKHIALEWYGMSSIQATVNDMAHIHFPLESSAGSH